MKRKPPLLDAPSPKHRKLSPEEVGLWHATMEETGNHGSTKIKTRPQERRPEKETSRKPPAASTPRTPASSLDKTVASAIRRGTAHIEATLDLHGMSRTEAYSTLVRRVEEWQARGVRTALVITGKGKPMSTTTLRALLSRWLCESPLRERIIAYDSAAPRHGGGGAWYVRLRKAAKANLLA